MGKIEMKGYAEKEVNADIAEYTISFVSLERKASISGNNVKNQCELFLNELKKNRFDIGQIHLSEDGISEDRYRNNDAAMDAKRVISFRTGFDPAINNLITDIISESNLNAEISVNYSYSKTNELHDELLKEAVINSRRKAEMIAEATGQKVKDIDSVSDQGYVNEEEVMECCCKYTGGVSRDELFSKLSGKVLKETETIYVTWVID